MEVNKVYNKSCENMDDLPDDSVDLIITSPPYFSLKSYAQWDCYKNHLGFIDRVISECYRVLHPGQWICWNIQECVPINREQSEERQGCYPLLADTIQMMRNHGFFYEKDIIWYKGQGTASQKLFGSFPYPSLILTSGLTEHIITARKPLNNSPKKQRSEEIRDKSKLTKDEWGKWAVDLWHIPPVASNTTNHPAPFPVELAYRCIRLNSFYDDVILDPFMGSGTTAIASQSSGRNYVGYEIHENYITMFRERLNNNYDIFA